MPPGPFSGMLKPGGRGMDWAGSEKFEAGKHEIGRLVHVFVARLGRDLRPIPGQRLAMLRLRHGHGKLRGRPAMVVLHGGTQTLLEGHFPHRPVIEAGRRRGPCGLVGAFASRGEEAGGGNQSGRCGP